MDALIVFGAKYLIWIAVAVAVFFFLAARVRTKRKLFLLALISLPITYLVGAAAGHFFYNPRPFTESGMPPLIAHAANNGFPSDHTLLAAALAMLVLVYNRPLGILLWILAALVGISRVAAGVHHITDIVGSAVIAAVVVYLVWLSIRRARWYRGRR